MSQNPYGQYSSDPNHPSNPGSPDLQHTVYSGPQPYPPTNPPAGPNAPMPPPGYGAYHNPPMQPPSGPQPVPPGYGVPTNPPMQPSGPQPVPPGYGVPINPSTPLPMGPGGGMNFPPPAPVPGPMNQLPNSSPGYPAYNPQSLPGGMPPASQPAPKKRKSGLIILIVVALLIILGGSIFAVASYNNSQASQHATATATAEVHAMTQATASSRATASASATALASTYPFSNKLVLHDQLSDDSHTAQYGWDQIAGQCFFINGSYNVRDSQATTYATCGAKQTNFTNFTFQVQMSIQLGGSGAAGGVIFRGNEGASQYYLFGLDAQGDYALFLENGGQSGSSRTLKQGVISNSNFIMGFNAVNTISVVARGSQIAVYVDDTTHPLFQIVDSTYSSGQIGFAVLTDSSGRAVVNYNAANVWQLP